MMFDLLDQTCAKILGITVKEYTDTIEDYLESHYIRAEIIMLGLLSDIPEEKEKAIRCFHMIK